jgi:hypothetical protein
MVKYFKTIDELEVGFKMKIFLHKYKKIHSKFNLKSFFFSLSLMYFDFKILKEIWIINVIKVFLKLIGQYGVQKNIFLKRFTIKIIVYSSKELKKNVFSSC